MISKDTLQENSAGKCQEGLEEIELVEEDEGEVLEEWFG
jgi:hypothetical protein